MEDDGRGVAHAILGIVAVTAVVGLVLLFSGATGQGVYGGQMRQGEDDRRPVGQEPWRYVTMPGQDDTRNVDAYYEPRHKGNEVKFDICPGDDAFTDDRPVVVDPSRVGHRPPGECVPSPNSDVFMCCALGGQRGDIATGEYEG